VWRSGGIKRNCDLHRRPRAWRCITLQALRSIIDRAPEHRFLCIILDNSILSEGCFIFFPRSTLDDQSVSFRFVGAGRGYFSTLPFMLHRARIYAFLAVRVSWLFIIPLLTQIFARFILYASLVMYFGSAHVCSDLNKFNREGRKYSNLF
jgi:hypothetical protein